MKHKDGLTICARRCMSQKENCQVRECRLWIDYKDEYNCCLISIYENERMTLRQVAERLGISFARVKQIETHALKRIKKYCLNKGLTF